MKEFYGVHQEKDKFVLSLTGYDPNKDLDINPHTGRATHFTEIERVEIYGSEERAMLECRRLNLCLV